MSKISEQLGLNIDFYFVLICWGLIFTRIFVMLLLTPFLGTRAVPGRVRMAMAIAFSLFLYPLIVPPIKDSFPANNGIILALFFKEIFFGLSVGIVTLMVFYALEAAGRVVDSQRGGANAQVFVPQLGQVSIFGLYNFWLAIALFISVGGHRDFLEAFFLSFQTLPLLELPHLAPGFSPYLQFLVRLSGDVLIIAMQLAAPVLIAILLLDMVLGIANKMAPQINVFELGFALKGYAGPLMIYVSLLVLMGQINHILKVMIQHVSHLSKLLAQ
ncbi:MAG: hypothetical protein A3G32_01530 [Deltaproteobacteria bacterium RIFCSPLOWO2_12_FULL_40_28]|nr:MAG: hypothetical protein A3C45_06275 [Deltaproteobacteria bacterium RIFCSPHIGHO2_02_FULL_40_28]OGQ18814.1 MAG: hypothetical protein A3E27_08910 [Deltaproteobacteria bacterium RIFCSPHIGHO2_12_FULL_40_32]OGQ40059.1 MAG: hypothetical protein A3I69_01440 [Deltaproteobacteria bacterium RIFCSPLOWO2_02_FULL_40_36]OGQ53242.1 MAG: hypothetical protein A3G32_01530 [Deltaproteobacteria bacterium RIFCSPLOWO2_12_FULL_40_28]